MDKIRLGNTDLMISKLSIGGLYITSDGTDFEEARRTIFRALELGVNYIDTAPGYSDSEYVLGKILKEVDRPYCLSTKIGGGPQPFDPRNKDQLLFSVNKSLELLNRDYFDILFIHEPDRPGQYDWFDDWENFSGTVIDIIEELKEKSLIRYSGIGGTTVYEMTRIVERGNFDVLLTAFNYSLLFREAGNTLIPAARKKGMGIIAGSPLQQAWFSRRYDSVLQDKPPAWISPQRREQLLSIYNLADRTGLSLPELALRFVISNPEIDTVLSGVRYPREIESNILSVEAGPLPENVLKELDEIYQSVPFRPCEEPFIGHFSKHDPYLGAGSLR